MAAQTDSRTDEQSALASISTAPTGLLNEGQAPILLRSQRRRMVNTFLRNRAAVAGLIITILIVILAVAAPKVTTHDPLIQEAKRRLEAPGAEHILGTDTFGRDVYSRVVYAARVSLLVGVLSVLLGGTLGVVMGLIAGYVGGTIELLIMRFVDILMAFPSLLLGLTVLAVLGPGLGKMILAIGIMLSPAFARVVHGATLALKRQAFIEAARCVGVGQARILRLHILPNVMGEIVVLGSLWTASAIRVEASLSFIGLGVSPPTPTWGNMIRDGAPFLIYAPWLSVFPGLAVLITVLAFNLLGDGLRDVLDPRLQL